MPTSARKSSNIPYDVDSADPIVAIAQTSTPAKITLRGPTRSAIGPDTSDAMANTTRFTVASMPSCAKFSLNSAPMNGVMPYTTWRSR